MSFLKNLFNQNFHEYASYVIKDRAIPDLEDGLKPVQRRILHSLFEMDDGKFHKVANVVGHCMKYHPHGDASIYSALVVLANKDLFIDKQGNFGNIHTGDEASAARYIECRVLPLAKEVMYRPEITRFEDSYDGRNKEPVCFPAKIPVVLIQGAEGIAVGMSTKILPHNFNEVLKAVISCLRGEKYQLFPDFPTGGLVDVSEYLDGMGRVKARAKLDTKDPKKIVIRELPFGSTTESLIKSIEAAARKNRLKIAEISDFTTDKVEIEIKLARGVYSQEVVDALFAFTDCESSISVNLLVIKDGKPAEMTVSQIIAYYAKRLIEILTAELKIEEQELKDRLHARTLEQIFIEERIYKKIEQMDTQEKVLAAVQKGFVPFAAQIKREVTDDDVERLLKIPIRRISLYDINKARHEMEEIRARLKEIAYHLKHIVDYAVGFLDKLGKNNGKLYPRRTVIQKFNQVDVREVVQRDLTLRYDSEGGYLGYEVKAGVEYFQVTPFDKILIVRKGADYFVTKAPEKLFVDKGMLACVMADKELLTDIIFTVIYKDAKSGCAYVKRCRIEQFIMEKTYLLVPEDAAVLALTTEESVKIVLRYVPKAKMKTRSEDFPVADFAVKGLKAAGVRLSSKAVESAEVQAMADKKRKSPKPAKK